ncbi:MAG TPA: hypothetical protein VHQ47_08285 [Phycisphaerae bacterium]|nr:hypothetical protein [Phycisphaerae bacterium]
MAFAAILVLLLGLLLYAVGRHGRRVDLHLVCRACGFDLYCRPETSHRCPECGADTRRRRSMRVGNRRRRTGWVVTGLAFSTAGAALLAFASFTWAAHADWIAWRSLPSLHADLFSGTPHLRQRAAAELRRRITHGRGSPAQISALLDDLLVHQAKAAPGGTGGPWYRQWGDVIQAAIAQGRASPAQEQRYVDHALRITFAARPRVTAGDAVPLALHCIYSGGTELGPLGSAELRPDLQVSVDGHNATLHLARQSLDTVVPMPLHFVASLPVSAAPLSAGSHLLHVTMRLKVTLQHAAAPMALTRHADLAVEILPPSPAGPPSVELVANDEAAAAIARNLRILMPTRRPDSRGWVALSDPPLPVAMEIRLAQNGRTWVIGRILARPNDFEQVLVRIPGRGGAPDSTLSPHSGRAQLIFVPDPQLATGTPDVLEIWSGTLRVPITLP